MRKPQPTRTLNPLPFQDLEPHRFEGLVRALTWDFRDWQSLEAIGRSGSDEGIDIRGVEIVRQFEDEPRTSEDSDHNEDSDELDTSDEHGFPQVVVREWIIVPAA